MKKNNIHYFLGIFFIILSFYSAYNLSNYEGNYTFFIFILLICISTDLGGYFFGKIFKGKKLTKISPNKTISGVFGAFIFSIILLILFNSIEDINLIRYIILTLAVSSTSQLGDIFISYIKRKAKVKNSSNILPGHGGLLDRLDGIIFGIPLGLNLALII